jgi:hypothetical protein
LVGSKGIATLLAAKIEFFALPLKLDGLTAGYEFFADRIFLQGVAERNIRRMRTAFSCRGSWLSVFEKQPVGNIEKNHQDDYP